MDSSAATPLYGVQKDRGRPQQKHSSASAPRHMRALYSPPFACPPGANAHEERSPGPVKGCKAVHSTLLVPTLDQEAGYGRSCHNRIIELEQNLNKLHPSGSTCSQLLSHQQASNKATFCKERAEEAFLQRIGSLCTLSGRDVLRVHVLWQQPRTGPLSVKILARDITNKWGGGRLPILG